MECRRHKYTRGVRGACSNGKFFNLAALKCTFVVIFLLEDVTLLLYTLLILKISHLFFFRLKKMRPSSKIGPAGPTGQVLPGLNFGVNSANADEFKDSVDTFSSPQLKQTISKI